MSKLSYHKFQIDAAAVNIINANKQKVIKTTFIKLTKSNLVFIFVKNTIAIKNVICI